MTKHRKFKKKPRWKKKRVRKYLLPVVKCCCLNQKFPGSNAHHISAEIIIYIPQELHRHINHSLKSGYGMAIINTLAFQFMYGGLS
jgi:hypothetical protein